MKQCKVERDNRIWTIPNLLSFFRLCLIPVFVWLYCFKEHYLATAAVLVFSGLTDLVDGFIARRFHMISDLGKVLDPVADKLTQAAMLLCLFTKFPLILLPFLLMAIKEIVAAIMGIKVIKKTGQVHGANWHGKVNTCLLYAMMIVHVLWFNIPSGVSTSLILICVGMMLVSFVLYGLKNHRLLRGLAGA